MIRNSKMRESDNNIGFLELLTILFIGLKLTGHITWSWWWVLSPILTAITLGLLAFLIFLIIYLKNN